MNADELRALYRDFTDEAVRMETLQRYVVPGDEERQRAFLKGRPLPERPAKVATLQLVGDAVAAGKRIGRVHVVDRPLSDYVRYELEAAYPENAAAGEHILIADRAAHPALSELRRDFALFDGSTNHAVAVWYDYTPDGRLVGYTRGGPVDVRGCLTALELARAHAVPLAEFRTFCGGRTFS